ncbi:MAG: hypothetical protein ABIK28_14385 [Planctomycetota bacterium]
MTHYEMNAVRDDDNVAVLKDGFQAVFVGWSMVSFDQGERTNMSDR